MSDERVDPAEQARRSNEFFGPLVPGRMGCVFDHSSPELVIGHIAVAEVTNGDTDRTMALFRCTQMVLSPSR